MTPRTCPAAGTSAPGKAGGSTDTAGTQPEPCQHCAQINEGQRSHRAAPPRKPCGETHVLVGALRVHVGTWVVWHRGTGSTTTGACGAVRHVRKSRGEEGGTGCPVRQGLDRPAEGPSETRGATKGDPSQGDTPELPHVRPGTLHCTRCQPQGNEGRRTVTAAAGDPEADTVTGDGLFVLMYLSSQEPWPRGPQCWRHCWLRPPGVACAPNLS